MFHTAALIAMVLVCVSMLVMTLVGNEISKDFRPDDGGTLSDGEGNAIGVRAVQQQVTLSSSLPTAYFHGEQRRTATASLRSVLQLG